MRFRWIHIVCSMMSLMMMLIYISSVQATASSAMNDAQVDEQTKQLLMQKYGLEPSAESQTTPDFLSGDWGMSFNDASEVELLDKMMLIVPFWLGPAVWIFRMWV